MASNHWRQAPGRVLCCNKVSSNKSCGCQALRAASRRGLATGTISSCMSKVARVPGQRASCSGVPAYRAPSYSVSANMNGFVYASICTTMSGCKPASEASRGISQRVANVGTEASCKAPPPPWRAMVSSVSRSRPSRRAAICRAYAAPALVSSTPWRVRWNSCTPRKLSSEDIWRDTALCVSDSSRAACV
ncbi:hypothetical protein D3C72_1745640 [compost metagenome]